MMGQETRPRPAQKLDYLLLFRGTEWDAGLSPEEIQQVMAQLMTWFDGLHQKGLIKAGQPLGDEARTVSGRKGRKVADGPFAEAKEAIGGFLILQVDSMDEAVNIAKAYPCLEQGATVEVRPVAADCPTLQRVRKQMAAVAD